MSTLLPWAVSFAVGCYLLAMALSLVRLLRGPSAPDRILALDYLYLSALLVILALGLRYTSDVYLEAALLIALFGFLSSSALAKFLLRGEVIE